MRLIGMQPVYYDTVASALLWTLDKGLGTDFTPEVGEAWAATYAVLAGAMRDAAQKNAATGAVI